MLLPSPKAVVANARAIRSVIPAQKPRPPKLDIWDDYGSPVERIPASDPRWQWKGDWRSEQNVKIAATKSAEAAIDFEGTGAIIVGPYLPSGGTADVYLDGKLHRTVDVYPDEKARKNGESVWHVFKLKPGKHSVRLSVRGEPYAGSTGSDIGIQDLVVFR